MIGKTHSNIIMKNKHIGATQSGLDEYISNRIKTDSKFKPIDRNKVIIKATHSHALIKNSTHSSKETLKPENFGVVKNFGTHSIFSQKKINKGVTPSHPALNFTKQTLDFKTHSYSANHSFGLKLESNKITYNNPNLIKGTHSNYIWAETKKNKISVTHSNMLAHMNKVNATNSGTMSFIKNNKFGLKTNIKGITASINKEKKFYAKPNSSTQKLDNKPFIQFISQMSDNSETMLKTKKVTVNGNIITDPNYILKSGDVVRVGIGHYINGSKQIAIVK